MSLVRKGYVEPVVVCGITSHVRKYHPEKCHTLVALALSGIALSVRA